MRMVKDEHGNPIQVFKPTIGKTISLGAYTPTVEEVIILGVDVTITLDGIPIPYGAGTNIGLRAGILYSFSIDTPVHVM